MMHQFNPNKQFHMSNSCCQDSEVQTCKYQGIKTDFSAMLGKAIIVLVIMLYYIINTFIQK